jgi:hypothetical protein
MAAISQVLLLGRDLVMYPITARIGAGVSDAPRALTQKMLSFLSREGSEFPTADLIP